MPRTRLLPLALALLAAPACAAPALKPAPLTAAGAVSSNLTADYRIGATDMFHDYAWYIHYNAGAAAPYLIDERRATSGGSFSLTAHVAGERRRALGNGDIKVTASYPNMQSLRFQPYAGVVQDVDFLLLSSGVTAQRLTVRNTRKTPVRVVVTASESVRAGGQERRYQPLAEGVRVHRRGGRDHVATLMLPGATSWGTFESSAESQMPATGDLPKRLPQAASGIQPSASFTYPGDSVWNPLDDSPTHGDLRWTAYDSGNAADWYAVDFRRPRPVRAVSLDLFVDKQGCWAPRAITVQAWNGQEYRDVSGVRADPIPENGGFMTVRFDEVATSRVRVHFTWQGNGRYGGIRRFRTDPPMLAQDIRDVSTVAQRLTRTVAPGQTASFIATLSTTPATAAASPVSPARFQQTVTRVRQVNDRAKRLYIGDPVLDPFMQQQINLIAQTIYRPQGEAKTPSFVFSRGGKRYPGWTTDHQHAHEGLAYVPLAISDPSGLRGILRTFFAQQDVDGRVPYETGIKGRNISASTFPSLSMLTWRLYKATGDRTVLSEFLPALMRWNTWWYNARRDTDTGLFWWSSFESTRDNANPTDIHGRAAGLTRGHEDTVNPDLTALMFADNRFIARIHETLGNAAEARLYRQRAQDLKRALEYLWDEEAANYQYRARGSVQPDRRWIKSVDYGSLLPLWAEMVDGPRAHRMIREHLLNPNEMWRRHGIPSLSAADSAYTDKASSSTWNGQLWIQWNTFFVDALLHYGYPREADNLARRVANMQMVLLKQHKHFFEDYSADNTIHTTAIYDYNWGAGNIQGFHDIRAARNNGGRFSIYD